MTFFLEGTAHLKYVKDSMYQATVAISEFLQQITPSLVVLNVTQNELTVQVYNLNRPVDLIQTNDATYTKNMDDTFTINRPFDSTNLKIISIDFSKLAMPKVIERVGYIATATTAFQHFNMTKCLFVGGDVIYSEEHPVMNPMMIWYLYKVNSKNESEAIDPIKPQIVTKDGDGTNMFGMIYSSAFFMSQDFKQMKVNFEVNFTLDIVDIKLLLITDVEKAANEDGIVLIKNNMTYKYTQVNNTVALFVAMDKSCKEFSNAIAISYRSAPGDVLKIKDSSFDYTKNF
ncbi:hypothetical protein EIN_088890 [Entamoeba invadens IP1]|uniref:Uncharacterized protein n=1 Tax=Entamoeba invadens IP1 TaxID=370355 RepID=A0A0A1U0F3_ENTIV|nr:hypothetical protein EIN_088890 [Entamoeba invadens IP1]ELP84376.1 hypothetical protein EIN_088890 [Entamoeba invadens IP1]|eukprot:XP_004183722.1 hypothetical protein EIN_088890 [Entamoeba invadens IP1]